MGQSVEKADLQPYAARKRASLTEGSPAKRLLVFALPLILGNLFQQFYNMADTMIVGNFVGEETLAAVGASYALTNVFIMIAIGGGNGASVLTSQFLGAGQYHKVKTSVATSLITFLAVSILLGGFGLFYSGRILKLLQTPDNVLGQAKCYLRIYFSGLPFLFMYNVLAAVFNAMGDSRTPLGLLVFSSVLNVILDIVSVTALGRGVDGVAAATVVSQGVAACISFGILMHRLRGLLDSQEDACDKRTLYDMRMLGAGTRIALPTILQQSIVSVGMLLVQSVVNGFGSAALAGYSAATRIESICVVPMIATGNAVATFTAQNIGANKYGRVRQGYRASFLITGGFAVAAAAVLGLFSRQAIAGFLGGNPSPDAFAAGTGYLSYIAWFFMLLGMKACVDGVLRGAGDMLMFTVGNLANLTIRVSAAFYFAPLWGLKAVWCVVPLGWLANFAISFGRYLTGKWRMKKVI